MRPGRWLFAALARLVLPRRMYDRLGADLLATHDEVVASATSPVERVRLWWREALALLRAAVEARHGGAGQSQRAGRSRGAGPGLRADTAIGRGPDPTAAWSHRLADDAVHAFRAVARTPGHALFIVVTLGLGIGASAAVYSTIRHTLTHPLPYEAADRMVTLWRTAGGGGMFPATAEQADVWGSQADLVEATLPMGSGQKTLTAEGLPETLSSPRIPGNYFGFLGIAPVVGRSFVEEELIDGGPNSVILGYGTWTRLFGADPGVVGRAIQLDGEPWTVVGVGPRDAPLPTGIPTPPGVYLPLRPADRVSFVVARLRPDAKLETFQERIDTLVTRAAAEAGEAPRFGGTATAAGTLAGGRLRNALTTLAWAVGLLLLIACLNVSALLINRADARRHDTAVRIAMGVGRRRLIRQHVLESLLLGLAAGGLGVLTAFAGVGATRALHPSDLPALGRVAIDPPVLWFALGLGLLTSLVFGMLPSIQGASADALSVLRAGNRPGSERKGSQRVRWLLVVSEVALSFALLVGSGLLIRTMAAVQGADVGFEPDGLVVASLSLPSWTYPQGPDRDAALEAIRSTVERLGAVESASMSSGLPPVPGGVYFGTLEVQGRTVDPEEAGRPFFGYGVQPGYFETIGQPILAGRTFTQAEATDEADVFIVGESTARDLWPDQSPLGQQMRIGDGEWHTIVGVVADVPATGIISSTPPTRQLYTPSYADGTLLARTRGSRADAMSQIVAALRVAAPDTPIDVTEATFRIGESVAVQRFTMRLLAALAVMAAALASIGLYGVIAQTVGRRTREIGIRMSVGARASEIGWMVVRSGLLAVVVGLGVGVGLTLAGTRLIENQLYGVAPQDPTSFGGAALVLTVAALLATWVPARRAACVDPVRAITSE